MSSTNIFNEYLAKAREEYKELKTELGGLRPRLEAIKQRLLTILAGQAGETFVGERAWQEAEKARLEEVEKMVRWRMDRWLEIMQECIKALREAACRN